MAITLVMWSYLFFPAAVLIFEYAWDTLASFASRLDARRPESQRALLRLSARYKPIRRYQLPYWTRRKILFQRRLAALRWQRGGCYTDQSMPPQTPKFLRPFSPSQVFAIPFALFRLYIYVQEWLSWIKINPRPAVSNHIIGFNSISPREKMPISSRFDTDSVKMAIDNCATRSISPNPHHFEDLSLKYVGRCRGLGDKIGSGPSIAGVGTLVFTIQDDSGQWHVIKIPNSLYIPSAGDILISPQHWSQEAKDNFPRKNGTCYIGGDADLVLYWRQRKFKRTIRLDPSTNTAVFYSKPGARIFNAFDAEFVACEANSKPKEHTTQLPPDVLHEREAEGDMYGKEELIHSASPAADPPPKSVRFQQGHDKNLRREALTFDPEPSTANKSSHYFSSTIDAERQAKDKSAELMRWHYRLGHMPFAKLHDLAKLGQIPRYLANVPAPKCAACLFGAMTRLPWRTKPSSNTKKAEIFIATAPGQVVSVDQMVSTHPGFIAQITGRLTKRRYTAATVFVDHYSRLKYVHLMESLTQFEPRRHSSAFPATMESTSVATTPTTVASKTMPSSATATRPGSLSLSAASMPIFRTE